MQGHGKARIYRCIRNEVMFWWSLVLEHLSGMKKEDILSQPGLSGSRLMPQHAARISGTMYSKDKTSKKIHGTD